MERCWITHCRLDPALWQVALSSLCPPCKRVPRAERILPLVHMCTCAWVGKLCPSLGLDLTAKGSNTLGKALEIIRKRSSACQILVSILEAKLIFFLFLMILVQLRLRQYLQTTGRKRFKNNNRRALTGNNLISPNSPAVLKTRKWCLFISLIVFN